MNAVSLSTHTHSQTIVQSGLLRDAQFPNLFGALCIVGLGRIDKKVSDWIR